MSERYSRLFTLPENLYAEGSPVIIAAGALLKDSQTGKVLVQLKIKSVSNQSIKAIVVRILPLDTAGKPLGEAVTHQFLDLKVERNTEIGQKEPIVMSDVVTRAFEVAVTNVVFQDNSTWEGNNAPWEALPTPMDLAAVLTDNELLKQYQLKFGSECIYSYQQVKDLWFCPCGTINRKGERCFHCKKSSDPFDNVDIKVLSAERDMRIEQEKRAAAEKIDQLRKEAEERAIQFKVKAKKLGTIGAVVAVVVIVATLIATKVIIPGNQYRNAQALLDAGEYDAAIEAFAALGDYKDAADMATGGVHYIKAEHLLDAKDYDGAIAAFEAADGYKDSADRIADVPYVTACDMRNEGNYGVAISIFRSLGDYKDSAAQVNEILQIQYDQAAAAVESGAYLDAIRLFQSLNDFSDAADRAVDADYLYTKSLLDSKQYSIAISRFERLDNYKDSETLLLDAKEGMYQNALSLFSSGDYLQAASSFQSLGDYKGSSEQRQKIVDTIYAEAFRSFNAGRYSDALEQFKVQYASYPTLSSSSIKDYITFCEVKSINFDDGEKHGLSGIYDKISSVSDETLKNELLSLPQMRTIKILNGVWANGRNNITFKNGHWSRGTSIDDKYIFDVYYMNGHYCSNYPSASRFDEIYNISQNQFSHRAYINDSYMNNVTYTRQS